VRIDPLAIGEVERRALLALFEDGPLVVEEEEVEAVVVLKVTWLEAGRREENWDGEVEERPDCIVEVDPRDELIEGDEPELDDEAGSY